MESRKGAALILIILLLTLMLSGCSAGSKANSPAAPHLQSAQQEVTDAGEDKSSECKTNAGKAPAPVLEEKQESGSNLKTSGVAKGNTAPSEKTSPQVDQDKAKGTADKEDEAQSRLRLVVTRDFGQSLIFDRWVPLTESATVLEVTTANLETETAYGGVFITSINGIASGYTDKAAWNKEKRDWFLYYNGKIASTGANNIKVKPGDIIWWDYHDWSGAPKPLPSVPPSK